MKPAERYEFIRNWLKTKNEGVDVLYMDFVDAYAEHTGAKISLAPYGSNWCKTLSRDLGDMYRAGILNRFACGLPQLAGYGFPSWVYVYRLNEEYK